MTLKTFVYTFESPATLAVAHRLVGTGKIAGVILQRPLTHADKLRLVRRRLARYGAPRVFNELLFHVYYSLFLKRSDDRLRRTLALPEATRDTLAEAVELFDVDSLNGPAGRALIDRLRPGIDLEIDGGVDAHTIGPAAAAGARVFVAGSSVFGAKEGITAAVGHLIQAGASGK